MLKNKNDIKIKKTIGVLSVDLKVKLTLWSAIKMRIAGINNVLNKKKPIKIGKRLNPEYFLKKSV